MIFKPFPWLACKPNFENHWFCPGVSSTRVPAWWGLKFQVIFYKNTDRPTLAWESEDSVHMCQGLVDKKLCLSRHKVCVHLSMIKIYLGVNALKYNNECITMFKSYYCYKGKVILGLFALLSAPAVSGILFFVSWDIDMFVFNSLDKLATTTPWNQVFSNFNKLSLSQKKLDNSSTVWNNALWEANIQRMYEELKPYHFYSSFTLNCWEQKKKERKQQQQQ